MTLNDWSSFALGAGSTGVLAFAVNATVNDWSADAWAAGAGWTTAAVAVAAGTIAVRPLAEARRLQIEQAQPYVVAYMESNPSVDQRYIDLVIRNLGTTAAKDVTVTITPLPQRSGPDGFESVAFPKAIPTLVPN